MNLKNFFFFIVSLVVGVALETGAATNSTTVGNITWDFNSTSSFGGNGTAKWTNNSDYAKFDKSGTSVVNVNNGSGQVGSAGIVFGNVAGNWVFTNQMLQIGAGGVVHTLANGSLTFTNNVQLMAAQTWSINAAKPLKMLGALSGTGPLTLDAQGFLGNYTFAGNNSQTGATILTNGALLTLDYSFMGQNNAKLDPGSSLILAPGLIALAGASGSYAEAVSATILSGGGSAVRKSGAGTETLALGPITRAPYATYFQGADSIASTTTSNDASGLLGCWAVCNAGWASTNGAGAIVANNGTVSGDAGAWTNALFNANASAAVITNLTGPLLLNALRFGGTTFLDLTNNTVTLAGGGLMSANSNPTLTNGFIQSALPSGELFVATGNNANLTNYACVQDNFTNPTPTTLIKLGDQALILAGSNTYSGGTYLNGGTIQIPAGGNLGSGKLFVGNYLSASPASVAAAVLFNNPGVVSQTNSLFGSGLIANINSGAVNLTVTNSTSSLVLTNGAGTLRLFAQGNNTFSVLRNGSGTLSLDGAVDGSATLLVPTGPTGSSMTSGSGGTIAVDGGNWSQPNADFVPGVGSVLTVNGGTFTVFGGNGFNAASVTLNGGAFQTLNVGSRFSFNTDGQTLTINGGSMLVSNTIGLRLGNQNGTANGTGNSANFTGIQTNGTLFVIGGGSVGIDMGGSQNNGKTVSYSLSGGLVHVAGGGWLNIGADTNGGSATTFTMTGGKLRISGPIQGGQSTNLARQVFAFKGGTVVAKTIDSRNLRAVDGGATGTLINTNGVIAPGDTGAAGLTTILGNYSSSGLASLAIDIGGPNYPNAFTNGANFYDSIAVTTNVVLGGGLTVNLINGFVPTATQSFLILASTNAAITNVTGTVSGTFNNLLTGSRVAVNGDTNTTFDVVIASPWVVLTNYQSLSTLNVAPTNVVATIQNILGTNSVVITGAGGSGSSGYTVLTTTNLAMPVAAWSTNATGIAFGAGGVVNYTNAINSGQPQLFYQIRVP